MAMNSQGIVLDLEDNIFFHVSKLTCVYLDKKQRGGSMRNLICLKAIILMNSHRATALPLRCFIVLLPN